MRRMQNTWLPLLAVSFLMFSSCYKQFDPESYAPDLVIGGYTSTAEIAPENMVAYWGFNGNLNDSISGAAATNVGTTLTGGIKGQAIQCGQDVYVLATPSEEVQNMTSFTISYWVNTPFNPDGIMGTVNLNHASRFWGNINMFFENGASETVAKFKYILTSNTTEAGSDVYDLQNFWGTWNNMTLTYNEGSSTATLYVNGSRIAAKTFAGLGPLHFNEATTWIFGTAQFQTDPSSTSATGKQDWASYLLGALDEIRVYNVALSDADVNALVKLEARGK